MSIFTKEILSDKSKEPVRGENNLHRLDISLTVIGSPACTVRIL